MEHLDQRGQKVHDAMTLANEGPVVIRYPKGAARIVSAETVGSGLSANKMNTGDGRIAILAIGKMVGAAEKAVAALSEAGVSATLYDVRSCAVLDPAMIRDAASHGAVPTVEDGIRDGGIGAAIASQVHAISSAVPVKSLGVPTQFIPHDKPDAILARFGSDADGIVATAQRVLS